MIKSLQIVFILSLILFNCKSDEDNVPDISVDSTTPEFLKLFNTSDDFSYSINGDYIIFNTNDFPDHGSPYWNTSNSLYDIYNGSNSNFNLNPNRISSQDMTFKIPLNPSKATKEEPTSLGAIGVSINGVVFFNQYAGPNNQPLTNEINSFDQWNGHPTNNGTYHYHIEPTFLTQDNADGFLGLLLDGFPVYGPEENNITITNDDLDEYHGHSHATDEFPNGVYHYHFTSQDPYLNGSGYYGTPGTVTN